MNTEAPEKIYFSQLEDGRQYFTPAIPFEREFVEYMPVDAFIEKAWNWIEDNMLSSNQQDKSRFYYEQFINYMISNKAQKGEKV